MQTKCPMRCSSVRQSVSVFDQLFCETLAVRHCTSINVRIKPMKTSTKHWNLSVSLRYVHPCEITHSCSKPPRSRQLHSASAFQPFSHTHFHPFSPPSSRGHPLMRHPSPGHQLARPGPFPVRMQKGREAQSGQCEVEVPWRTKLPGWLSDEHGSVKGWARSFPQIISRSVSQPVLHWPSTNCNQAASFHSVYPLF